MQIVFLVYNSTKKHLNPLWMSMQICVLLFNYKNYGFTFAHFFTTFLIFHSFEGNQLTFIKTCIAKIKLFKKYSL